MASVLTYLNESLSEDLSAVKILIYSLPVFYCSNLFIKGEMTGFYLWASIFGVLFLGLLTKAINNVRTNKTEVLTLNPIKLFYSIILTVICLIPQILIFGAIGWLISTHLQIPVELPHFQLIFDVIVWALIISIILTSYLSFAKYLNPLESFNYKVIFASCVDILVSFMFFIPQLLLVNFVLIGPAAALCAEFNIPFTHGVFVLYCSIIFVINIPLLASYFAQSAFEHIKESNQSYDDNFKINDVIEDIAERLQ